jgi:hypothetical protein
LGQGAIYCPSTEQELVNLQNLYALRNVRPSDTELVVKLLEHTSRLLMAATLNSPEHKVEDSGYFGNNTMERPPRFHHRLACRCSLLGLKLFYLWVLTCFYFILVNNVRDATCTWSGQLPPRIHKNPTYSCKVTSMNYYLTLCKANTVF